jgi:hypothetical protein
MVRITVCIRELSALTLHTAVVSTIQSVLGSGRHGQAMLPLFQISTLLVKKYIVYCKGIASVKVKFCVLSQFSFVIN